MDKSSSYVRVKSDDVRMAARETRDRLLDMKERDVERALETLSQGLVRNWPRFWEKRTRTDEEVQRAFHATDSLYSMSDRIDHKYFYSLKCAEALFRLGQVETVDGIVTLSAEDADFLNLEERG